MDLREITNGAALAGAARNFGMEIDELVDFAIKTAQSEGQSVQQVLQKMIDSDLDLQAKELKTLGLDKYEDVLRGSEEADNSNVFSDYTQEERDKGYQEGKEDKRLRKAAENIADESNYRSGNYVEADDTFQGRREYRQDQRYPDAYDPQQDDFVSKRQGRILKFKKDQNGNYKPTNQPGGVIKRRMVKYIPGDTIQRYDPRTKQVKVQNTSPTPFYPGARNQEPFDATITGRSSWNDTYQRLTDYINSGAITSPEELNSALILKEEMKTNLDPGYAKARDFDRGVALVKQDRQGMPLDEINARVESDLRAMSANGESVRPIDAGVVTRPDKMASPAEIQAIREAAILKTINNPKEVEPAPGRRNTVDVIGAEAALRADYGSKSNSRTRELNNNRALAESIINESESGNFANDQLGRIGEVKIQGKGFKSNGKPDWIAEAPVDFSPDPSTFPDAYLQPGAITSDSTVYFDRPTGPEFNQGNPLAIQGPKPVAMNPNTPDIGQSVNAPASTPVINDMTDLLISQQFQTRQSGQYPQADISGSLNTFNDRLSRVRSIAPDVTSARTLNDVQASVDAVLGLAADKNVRLNAFGSKAKATNPGPMEVLAKMRYTAPEIQQLANSLLQLELGRTNEVNSLAKSEYFGNAAPYMQNSPIGLGTRGTGRSVDLTAEGPAISLGRDRMTFGETEQMSDYSVGDYLDTANQRVAPAFRKLTGENIEGSLQERRETLDDARRPYIGQVKGETVPIEGKRGNPNYRFNATGETDPLKIESAIRDQARLRASKKNPRDLSRESANAYNAQIVNARHYPDVIKVARAGDEGRVRNQSALKRNEFELNEQASRQTDPYTERPALGGGLTTYNPAASKSTGSSNYTRSADTDDSAFRAKVRKRLELGQRARAGAAIAGGVGAAIAGIDGLVGNERNKREEAQY